ncbi:MAG: hypothetical protein ABGX22_09700 [Pirellulaceae bacterium]
MNNDRLGEVAHQRHPALADGALLAVDKPATLLTAPEAAYVHRESSQELLQLAV